MKGCGWIYGASMLHESIEFDIRALLKVLPLHMRRQRIWNMFLDPSGYCSIGQGNFAMDRGAFALDRVEG